MPIRWSRSTKIAALLAAPLLLGGVAAAARVGPFSPPDCAILANDDLQPCVDQRTQAHLARVVAHRAQALAALRLEVPSSEVRDEDVTVIFWEPIPATKATPIDPDKAAFLGGYWLGKDRACVLAWGSKANAILSYGDLMRPQPKDGSGNTPTFRDFRAQDEASRRAFALVTRRAHYRTRLEDRPVVPISFERTAGGKLMVEYVDGWDESCGHESNGYLVVDLDRGSVEMGAHVN